MTSRRLPRPIGLVVFVLTYGGAYGVMTIARPALLGVYVPPAIFARVSGVQAMATDLGRVAAPVAAAALISWTGSYAAMLIAVAICSAAAAASLFAADAAS